MNNMNLLQKWFDPTINEPTPEYIVDTTNPPIGPPLITIHEGFFWNGETDLSIRTTETWVVYSKKYSEQSRGHKKL